MKQVVRRGQRENLRKKKKKKIKAPALTITN
jgi:hypothetical protein